MFDVPSGTAADENSDSLNLLPSGPRPIEVRASFFLSDINDINEQAETFEIKGLLALHRNDPFAQRLLTYFARRHPVLYSGNHRSRGKPNGSSPLSLLFSVSRAGAAQSGISGINTSFRASVPQIFADIDRDKAETLDVPVNSSCSIKLGIIEVGLADVILHGNDHSIDAGRWAMLVRGKATSNRQEKRRFPSSRCS